MTKRSFAYQQLISGEVPEAELERLAAAGELDAATLERMLHIGRFFQAISKVCPNHDLTIGDTLTDEEIARIWQQTADPDSDVGPCPLIH
jgi:hypothetical protein